MDMRMDYGLKLDVSQKLLMTPQLRQAIAILQLSSVELTAMIEQALLENPVLEEIDDNGELEAQEQAVVEDNPLDDYFDWADYFNEGTKDDYDYGAVSAKEQPSFELFAANRVSLHEHLELQLHLAVFDDTERMTGKYLIGCIDDNGYLQGTIAEAALHTGQPEQCVEKVLLIIQTFDPVGVGARDLRECLAIQLAQKGIEDELVIAIVDQYLDDVGQGKFKNIAEKLGCRLQDIQQAVDLIRSLDPKPGSSFDSAQPSYIVPDIAVERVNGQYVIVVNDTSVPRLSISPYYRHVTKEVDSEARKFVEGRLSAAVWLIRSIEQRRRTLYSVMEAIIDLQREFFDFGPKMLRPLTMKRVADRVGVHESTVSRAIANKYTNTPHGLFSLRSFFSAGIQAVGGEDVASGNVKREIKEMLGSENAKRPLSDQAIADMLVQKGITVSRRTVTKYREEMGIVSSSKRKRY